MLNCWQNLRIYFNKYSMKNNIKKIFKFVSSRAMYLLIGLFLALAIFGVRAAWNSTVSSGQPLTSALWNDVVAKLVELDNRNCYTYYSTSLSSCNCPSGETNKKNLGSWGYCVYGSWGNFHKMSLSPGLSCDDLYPGISNDFVARGLACLCCK